MGTRRRNVYRPAMLRGATAATIAITTTMVISACGGSEGAESGVSAGVEAASQTITRFDARGPAVLALPNQKTKRVVVYFHGAGERGDAILTTDLRERVAGGLLKLGFAVAGADAHGDSWGSPSAQASYRALLDSLTSRGLTEMYLLGESMGALNAVNLATRSSTKAVALVYPVCDLRTMRSRFAASIDEAYGAASQAAASPSSWNAVRGLPVLTLASNDDTLVVKRVNADVCAETAERAGAVVTQVTTKGDHADPSDWEPAPILRFFSR